MIELTRENFEAEITGGSGLAMVDFWSPKCEPCMALLPDVEALAVKYGGKLKFAKVNAIANRRLAISQKVLGLPTILFYREGQRVAELTGDDVTPEAIESQILSLL
jgi:thioredoxin 1